MLTRLEQITKTQIMYDPHSRDSRGFAFVTFETAEEADAALEGMNGVELSGRTLVVQKARRSRARSPTPGRYHGPPKCTSVYPSWARDARDVARHDESLTRLV